MNNVLVLDNVSKQFKGKLAINNISLSIKKGEIKGLIGRNGAGKTTVMSIICGLCYKTDGDISIFLRTSLVLLNKKLSRE